MRAVVRSRYGGPEVLSVREGEAPAPGPGQVRVRVAAAGVAKGDIHLLRGTPFLVRLMFGLRRPRVRILGSDMAGTVDAVGSGVEGLRPGDEVVGHLAEAGFGAFAESVVAPVEWLVPKPPGASFAEAASLPGSALAALQGLRLGGIEEGHRVLVNGASGGVGTAAVQIARALGAEVTGTASPGKVELVRSLGAHRVLDYTREDFTRGEDRWDLILDTAARAPLAPRRRVLTPRGVYVFVGGDTRRTLTMMALAPLLSGRDTRAMRFLMTTPTREALEEVVGMMERGEIRAAVDRTFPLEDAAEALRWLEAGKACGKLVLTMDATTPA